MGGVLCDAARLWACGRVNGEGGCVCEWSWDDRISGVDGGVCEACSLGVFEVDMW